MGKEDDKKKDKDKKDKDKDKDKEKDKKEKKDKDKKEKKKKEKENDDDDNDEEHFKPITHGEKCDGCFVQEGIVYCTNCEKTYCKMCEDQIHIVPRMKSHSRIPVNMMYNLKKLCYNHGNKLNLYCETCEEPICHDCFNLGPHNSRLHRVVNTIDSFRKKFNLLKQVVKTSLKKRYDLYLDQLQFLDFNIEEIKSNKNILERNIQQEYLTMIDRLRAQEGKKMAILNYDSSLIQREINKIHDLCNFVSDNSMQNSPDMIDFLLKFKKTKDSIDQMLQKPVKTEIEVQTNDFTNDLEEKRKKLQKFEKANEILKVKDDIIWNMMQEKKQLEEKELIKIKERTQNEITEWAKLSDKYSNQLEKYILVCYFCGRFLEPESVNTQCQNNTGINDYKLKIKYSDEAISSEHYNTRRHYFSKPSADYDEKMNQAVQNTHISKKLFDERVAKEEKQLEEIKAYEYEMKNQTKNNNTRYEKSNKDLINLKHQDHPFNRNSNLDLKGIKEKIKYFSELQKIDTENLMENFFKGRDNTHYDELKLLLQSKFLLSENECNRFLSQIISQPPTIGLKHSENNIGDSQIVPSNLNTNYFNEENQGYQTTYNFPSNYKLSNIDNDNQKVKLEDLVTLFKRSGDFPKRPPNYDYSDETQFEKERRLINKYKNSNVLSNNTGNLSPKTTSVVKEFLLQILSTIQLFNINFFQILSEFDKEQKGYITKESIAECLNKMNIHSTLSEINALLVYFSIFDNKKIPVSEFATKVMNEGVKLASKSVI